LATDPSSDHYYLTISDQDESTVLELVWVAGENYFIRDNGTWLPINPDDDNPRIWDVEIVDVTSEAAREFDAAELENALDIKREMFEDYEILEEEAV
jgi:hypothetical protein